MYCPFELISKDDDYIKNALFVIARSAAIKSSSKIIGLTKQGLLRFSRNDGIGDFLQDG
jgi:hypothetical protein